MSTLSDRLDQIAARRRLAAPAAAPSPPRALDTAAALGGRELNSCADLPPCWCVETPVAAADAGDPALSAVVIDIETGGFAGHPVFLIGVMPLGRRPPTIVQWLARDYPEEPTLLHLLAATVAEPPSVWVTFNGRGFDEPFLRDRSVLHGVPLPTPSRHIDVLPAARRRWRTVVPDCRLETLESHILGRTRVGDVPGRDIPELFHHFVRTRNARPLRPVLERNRLDLLATTALFQRLLAERQVSLTAD